MATGLEGRCRVFGLREGEPLRRAGLAVWRHVGRDRGASAISLAAMDLAPGGKAGWRNRDCDEVLFVLAGEGSLRGDDGEHRLGPGTGVFVPPRAPVAIENSGLHPLVLLTSRCPDPGPEILFDAAPSREEASLPLRVVRFENQPTERAGDGRWFRVLVDAKTGSAEVTQFVGFIPTGRAPDHFHEYEEVVCILDGEGRFWSGDSFAPLSPGTCLYLPRRQPHCLENTGAAPLKLYGLFYPAGSPAARSASR